MADYTRTTIKFPQEVALSLDFTFASDVTTLNDKNFMYLMFC